MKCLDLGPRPSSMRKIPNLKTLQIFNENKGKLSPGLQHLAVALPPAAAAVGRHQPPPVESVRIRPAGS